MPTMRMPWSKSGNLQLDLLDVPTQSVAAPLPPAAPGASARSASMVPTANLYEDANNPRTEILEAELDELANDIRQQGILQPIVVHTADAAGRHQIHFGAKRWRASEGRLCVDHPLRVRSGVEIGGKGGGVLQASQRVKEFQPMAVDGIAQVGQEYAPEQP